MINNISNLFIIIVIMTISGWFLLSIDCIHTLKQFNATKSLSDEIQKTTAKEFVINNSSNILKSSLNRDNSIPAAFESAPWQLTQTVFEQSEIPVNGITLRPVLDENAKIHNDFYYGINKNNQENNSDKNTKLPTTLLSNIKLVNSSTLWPSPSQSTSSPRATDSGTESTNSTSAASSYFERVEMHESLTHTKNEKLLLHRNKRYLVFPEGSSFQLVFDLIIPIVDYTNFAIMGITCAVAWELPSKPPSEIIENFRTKLNDGSTYGLRRRNDSTQQSLEYINSQRNEQEATEGIIRWREGETDHTQDYLPQLPSTFSATSGRENFLANAAPTQPSSYFYYNNYIKREKIQTTTAAPATFFYGQHPQQQQWPNYNYETFDANQRKTLYTNSNREGPIYRNVFTSQTNKHFYNKDHYHPASKWNVKNRQKHPQKTKMHYTSAGDYWNKDNNWWESNKNRIGKHWQKNQQKWSQHQKNPRMNYQTATFSKRTSRNRNILNKPPKHRIYPIFGKRKRRRKSTDHHSYSHSEVVTKKLQNIHAREHLQTRQKLYGKIEKLYKTRGQNGTACVLRALCETTKRMHSNCHYNEAPQSFVMELLRSIFALPKDTLTKSKELSLHLHGRYMDAVMFADDVTQSCSEKYNGCEYSIIFDS